MNAASVQDCRTAAEAQSVAMDVALSLRTYADACLVTSRFFVRELLPPECGIGDEIGDNLRFRQRVRDWLFSGWKRAANERIADAAIDCAIRALRSRLQEARLAIGMNVCNGRLMLLQRLQTLVGK